MTLRKNPHILQLNAYFFLSRMREKYGDRITLDSVPDKEWRVFAEKGMDAVWLMGVWKRSPKGRAHALKEPNLTHAYNLLLPGWTEEDVVGSPYAVYDYELDPGLGGSNSLSALRKKLNGMGLRLILDFVPNHLAIDHPWTESHPCYFVPGAKAAEEAHPEWFFKTASGKTLAHGRDPFFSAWIDTVQVNFNSEETREAMIGVLLKIAEVSDGVRCDMAMLALRSIFDRVWGPYLKKNKGPMMREFWDEAIHAVKKAYPEFMFIAEVYWDLEWTLQQLGFDFTYDKKMYDRLLATPAKEIYGHLSAELSYQARSMHFLENHDEERAVATFGEKRSQAAAAVIATVPGLRFFQDGQWEGQTFRTPIHLRREAKRYANPTLEAFYDRLLDYANAPVIHEGQWLLLNPTPAWEGDTSYENILAWAWYDKQDWKLIVVNYSMVRSWARVPFPVVTKGKKLRLHDELSGEIYLRDMNEISRLGLYVELAPWQSHLF